MGPFGNPVVLRLLVAISLFFIIVGHVLVLEVASLDKFNGVLVCTNKSRTTESITKSCWTWNLDPTRAHCPFDLMFASFIIFTFSFLVAITTTVLKFAYRDYTGCIQRRLCCRWVANYLQLGLNVIATGALLGFIGMVLTHTEKQPCFQVADMLNNCMEKRGMCWMFALTCTIFFFGLLASMLSGWHSAHMYRKMNEDEKEALYRRYVDYSSMDNVSMVN